MKRGVRLPFGAEVDPEGATLFRLWAPNARAADVIIESPDLGHVAMQAQGDGWFSARVAGAGHGTRYRYRVDDGIAFPDAASRSQPDGVHGSSEVIDPRTFEWADTQWRGRPWAEVVISEAHVGTLTAEGTFAGAIAMLDHYVETGITALELMPIAEFPGKHDWGYNGAYLFAPAHAYGSVDDLKRLVVEAHARGLMIFLDVVYNHFGPEGNYLGLHAPGFFTDRHQTPWGQAIDFAAPGADPVREFMAANAAYWIGEFGFDGLRLDAVHAIYDGQDGGHAHVLEEVACSANAAAEGRQVHLMIENDNNAAWLLDPHEGAAKGRYRAQWNDDCHHAAHVLMTGEIAGYYSDYQSRPIGHLARTLAEGFAFQGEPSPFRDGELRGEVSAQLPPHAFVTFLQNHDQIGNRAFGERLTQLAPPEAVEAMLAVTLLAPSIPLLFMGEEWGAQAPFPFFCDLSDELGDAVREGRKREFAAFITAAHVDLPDPVSERTANAARLDFAERLRPPHSARLGFVRDLLKLRAKHIVPLLCDAGGNAGTFELIGPTALDVRWKLAGAQLRVWANLGAALGPAPPAVDGEVIYSSPGAVDAEMLPPWSVAWTLSGVRRT